MSKYIKTGETTDYSLFVIPKHQRDENEGNVKGIVTSMKEVGAISAISVTPSIEYEGKYEVYDGQHVITASKRLGLPVVYNVFKDVSKRAMVLVNNKSRNWKFGGSLENIFPQSIKIVILACPPDFQNVC